jgi:hypothetical protein
MSTRSAIIMKDGDGYKGVYCHSDGYLSWNGKILLENYQGENKVRELIGLGHLSILRPELDSTTAYARDGGEDLVVNVGPTLKSVEEQIGHDGYVYVFENGEWHINGEVLTKEMIDRDE